jgi:hypothetical protein
VADARGNLRPGTSEMRSSSTLARYRGLQHRRQAACNPAVRVGGARS